MKNEQQRYYEGKFSFVKAACHCLKLSKYSHTYLFENELPDTQILNDSIGVTTIKSGQCEDVPLR